MQLHRPQRTGLVGLALAGVLLTAACSGADGKPGSPAAAGIKVTESLPAATKSIDTLHWALYAEPSSLDPIRSNDFPPMEVLANLCESLGRINPDFTISPALATSWTNPDPTTWVYEIRAGVTFHSGAPLTADDVAYSLNRNLDQKLGSNFGGVYENVKDIRATGPLEVTVRLKEPDALFNQSMATPAGRVLDKASTEKAGEAVGTPTGGIDCTGPYKLDEWKTGTSITLTRNDAYWDDSLKPHAAKVDFEFIRDPAARINALLSGQVDGSWLIPASGYGRLLSSSAGTLSFGRTSGSYVGMVTNLKGGLADVRIRRALSMVINRPGLIKAAVASAAEPLKAPASPGTWGYAQDTLKAGYDALPDPGGSLKEAKALVDEAGLPKEPITVAVTSSQSEMPIIGAEVARAGKALGIDVRIKTLSADGYNALYSDAGARKGIDMIFSLWQTDFPDPTEIYQYLQTTNYFNYAQWSDPTYDKLVSDASHTTDEAKRAELIVQAQKIAADAMIWVPLYAPFNSVFLSKGLTGAPTAAVQLNYPWAATIGGK
ncbi:ABC transporter substrate-binding protein [Nocardioides ginsengisoli]|uniref:ABC transporter substrate-binding protein n=1 Tax=Nocardioides ginsengisoli TaxID=363868 RepID=A0ABW3W6B1_9ACTN